MTFERSIIIEICEKLAASHPQIQVIIGPRQVGKTVAAEQVVRHLELPAIIATADTPLPPGPEWIDTHWRRAELEANATGGQVLLVLDEIQKVAGWSEVIKQLWDQQNKNQRIKLLILGSSALIVQQGLTESLAGRFFLHRFTHWDWQECRVAFGWDLNQWIYFGGYPGAARYTKKEADWKNYVRDSLIETVISKDVLQLQPIRKPVLLRHLFILAAAYPAQILSYNNMLGQLHDAGNTTTLAEYLHILSQCFLVSGLERFSRREIRKKGSSPKLVFWNNALINALSLKTLAQSIQDPTWWGRLTENAVGSYLLNQLRSIDWRISYWRESNTAEVDYVIEHGADIWAIEVKSGRSGKTAGLQAFRKAYPQARVLTVGGTGIPLEEFFEKPVIDWLI